jgi:hypothetical protein
LAEIVEVVILPGIQVKLVEVPEAVNTVEAPAQMVALGAETVGSAITVTVAVVLFVQIPLEPVMVYVVFELAEIVEVVILPGIHVKLVAVPEAVNTVDVPAQIVAFGTEMVGADETVTLVVCVPLHKLLVPLIV